MAVKYLSHLETLNINMQGYELQNAVIHTLTNNTRPINPNVGQVIYNTDNQTLELWDGVNWSSVSGDITSITITTGVGLQGGVVGVTGAVTGTISLNHLGLEDLVDPNKDSIFYWNDLTKKSEFLDIGDGLLINSGVLSNTIINNDQLINGSGYITASSSDTLTNKSGNISQWTNDVGYITDGNTNWNNTYGFITGINWDEITGNQLDINLSGFNNDSGFTTFDGDYNSLSNLPTIPTNNNQLINGAGYITNGNDGWVNTYGFITGVNWDEIGGLQSDINLSEFTNDVGFVSGDEFDSSGTYLNLRAQATTKDDVGLGNVENITLSTYTGNGGSLDNQYIINSEGYITGINWDGIGGTQSDINLSGFTNDIGFSTFDGDYNSLTNIPTYTQGSIIFADSDGSLTENNTQLYWDDVNNRLGIGTNNPTAKLEIHDISNSTLKLIDTTNNTNLTLSVGNFDSSIYSNGRVFIQSSTALSISNIGNVGIGIASPVSAKFHVVGNSLFNGKIILNDITDSQTIELNPDGDSYINGGNVGIGTTSPTEALDVSGNIKADSVVLNNYDTVLTEESTRTIIGAVNRKLDILNTEKTSFTATFDGATGLHKFFGTGNSVTLDANAGKIYKSNAYLDLYHNQFGNVKLFNQSTNATFGSIIFGTSDTERMRIDSTGNVGIGTSDPSAKLNIYGNSNYAKWTESGNDYNVVEIGADSSGDGVINLRDSANGIKVKLYAEANASNYIVNGGNFGLGTTNPSAKLNVSGSVNNNDVAVLIQNNYDDNLSTSRPAAALLFGTASNNGYLRVYGAPADTAANHQMDLGSTATGSYLTFSLSGNERMRITSTGNIGIGTTTPNNKLDIDGDIRVKRTNRKPTHEDVLTSDFVSVGSVSFYTDDWVKVKVIGRGDTGVNKSFAEYLIYYDGTAYNIELLNNIVIGDNSGFPLLRMNGSNLEIKNRDSVNVGNYLIYFDDFISQTLFSGKTYRVEDFPLIWINDLYYNTYKDNTFVPNQNISIPNQSEYDAVTNIDLDNQNLTTDFTLTFLSKFVNLQNLSLESNFSIQDNFISIIDVSENYNLQTIRANFLPDLEVLNVTNLTELNTIFARNNKISVLNITDLTLLTYINVASTLIEELDTTNLNVLNFLRSDSCRINAENNSKILVDLDTHGLSNGYLNSTIFGTGFITPTGIDSFNALLSKSWNIVGLTNQLNAGSTYNVEDFPKIWIDDLYYNTYKGDTFVPSVNTLMTGQIDYDTVTSIFLNIKSLTTDFTGTLLGKFNNLSNLQCFSNQISVLDVSQNTNLTQLMCYDNQLTALDVSQLVNLNILYCFSNQISTLDVSQLTSLTVLYCFNNQISVLDVSQLVNLTSLLCDNNQISTLDVSQLVNLTRLHCFTNQITTLDLSQLTSLTVLQCYNNQIATLDVSQLTSLTTFFCFNNLISVLDVSNLVNLTDLRCQNNELDTATNSQILADLDGNGLSNGYFQSTIFGGGYLTPLGVESAISLNSKNWNIVGLTYVLQTGTSYDIEDFPLAWIEENNFATYSGNTFQVVSDRNMPTQTEYDAVTDIDLQNQALTTDFTGTLLGKFSNLNTLRLQTNSISIIETSTLQNIKLLLCNDNNISVLDVASLTTLTDLYCFNNNISVLDVTNLTLLADLRCHNNNISALDVTNLTLLTSLRCHNNNISALDVTNLTLLRFLYCYNNNISVLDVTNLTLLTSLYCLGNNISVLNTSNLTELIFLSCFSNNISILDISNCLKLTYVHCFDNNISILDVSNAIDLYYIWCSYNNISILDLSSLSKLTFVRCEFNNISNLDLSVTTILATLFCYDNQLVDLDVSNCFLLSDLRCYNNQLDNLVNSQILIDLDNNGLSNGFLRSSIFGGGSLTAAGQTAKTNLLSKGWTIVGI